MESMMRELYVWRLTCIDANSDVWQFSKYRGTAMVRASSEREARLLARERFGTGPSVVGEVVQVGNPWASPITVLCVRLESHAPWSSEGPAEVVQFDPTK